MVSELLCGTACEFCACVCVFRCKRHFTLFHPVALALFGARSDNMPHGKTLKVLLEEVEFWPAVCVSAGVMQITRLRP